MQFEWDENKSRANQIAPGINFDLAATAFYDPHSVYGGPRLVRGERRYWLIGRDLGGNTLFVVYTWRQHEDQTRCRIISARKASRKERSRYQALQKIPPGEA
jgi:uncharacterized DUF497 family protein